MANEPEFIITDVTEQDYKEASAGFVTFPLKNGQPAKVGDSMLLKIKAGKATWKEAGKSLLVPFTVTSEGENYGKKVEVYPGVSKEAMSILKQICKALNVESKVITYNDKKQLVIKPNGFEGAEGLGNFIATMTVPQKEGKTPVLVAKLNTTEIYPVTGKTSGTSTSSDLGL
jgi:hypothetical protein